MLHKIISFSSNFHSYHLFIFLYEINHVERNETRKIGKVMFSKLSKTVARSDGETTRKRLTLVGIKSYMADVFRHVVEKEGSFEQAERFR